MNRDQRISREGRNATIWDMSGDKPYMVAFFCGDAHRHGIVDAQIFLRGLAQAEKEAAAQVGKLLKCLPAPASDDVEDWGIYFSVP